MFFHVLTLGDKYIILCVMSISGFFRKLFRRKPAEIQEVRKPLDRYILCIDGGGMRGIVPVVLLRKLESLIRENGGTDDIARYFDLIAGTSTGGLITLALTCKSTIPSIDCNGSAQVNLDSLLEQYMSMGSEIFPKKIAGSIQQFITDKYDSTNIQNCVKRWFGTTTMKHAKVPTLVMAYDISAGQPMMIRNYADEADYPAWVAGRATSAAPTYFSPCEYKGKLLVDGGIIANNPVIYAYFEAKKLYPDCERFHILSISTSGSYHTMKGKVAKGLVKWGDHVYPMFDTAQKRTAELVITQMQDVDYLRIDDPLPKEVEMDETDPVTLNSIKDAAETIAENHSEELKDYCIKLIENMENRKNAPETGRA